MLPEELRKAFDLHAKWLEGKEGGVKANFRGVSLHGIKVRSADIRFACLQHTAMRFADIQSSNMSGVSLQGADLRFARIRDTDLTFTDFQGADMQGATLQEVELQHTLIRSVSLEDATLSRVNLKGAILRDTDLQGARFKDTISVFGEKVSEPPILISGLRWSVMIWGSWLRIGCEDHLINDWKRFNDSTIAGMHPDALLFWKKYKAYLLD